MVRTKKICESVHYNKKTHLANGWFFVGGKSRYGRPMTRQNFDEAQTVFTAGNRVAVMLPVPMLGALDYLVGRDMVVRAGDYVCVNMAGRERIGIVWGPGLGDVAAAKLKPLMYALGWVPPLLPENRKFIDCTAHYTLAAPGAVLKMLLSTSGALEKPKPLMVYKLSENPPPWRATPPRTKVVDYLKTGTPATPVQLAKFAGVGASVVRGLIDADVLTGINADIQRMPSPDWGKSGHALSKAQSVAATRFVDIIDEQNFHVTLLEGVPGSGKTEVYFEGIAKALSKGQQVLVLLPEIALGSQWRHRFKDRFGVMPVDWHSGLTPAKRRDTWRAVAAGVASVVVGARSALFLPFAKLGLIVVDEEHDTSFKQEEGVFYNARDMAVVRARLGGFAVLLASATPSLESRTNVLNGRYEGMQLPDRHGGASLPDIDVVDMVESGPGPGQWLSSVLQGLLTETFAKDEQALLFLNRRGYAPLTLCRKCGHRFQCPRCSTWLVEHHFQSRLQCHHCGYSIKRPDSCPECESKDTLMACGPGVERLAEEAKRLFPEARITIADSDHVSTQAAAAELVEKMENRDIDLVIGTQMIAKGYHFPYLTLVGVIDADLGLAGGDLRAAERTFQMLYQVAGRAGRSERPGRVILQSYLSGHPVIKALVSGERESFFEEETAARKDMGMPPFGRLVALIVSGVDENAVDQMARGLARTAPRIDGVEVWGPAPAPIQMLRGRHRRRLLFKARRDISVQPIIRKWMGLVKRNNAVRVQVDIDPISFM